MKTDILVITALAMEFKAVERLLVNLNSVKHETGAQYKLGVFPAENSGNDLIVALVEAGAGNINASQETERALTFFGSEYVFFVGVAGGIKDVKIGDVVASSEVIHYEGGKADVVYKPRLNAYSADYELVSLAKSIARDELWQRRIDDGLDSFKAEVKPIAAGEKVVSSERSVTYELLNQSVSQAMAVEMEGYGFFAPVHSHRAKGIVIRGISDLLNNKEASDASGSQPLAARNAVAFLAEMLTELSKEKKQSSDTKKEAGSKVDAGPLIHPNSANPLDNLPWRSQLAKMLSGLYETGPTDNGGAWKRAGGSVGFLSNSNSNESQWFTALDRLNKGGAGNITLESLLEAVQDDFGNNDQVRAFCDTVLNTK